MPLDAPFQLGPFTVEECGRLIPTTEGRFPAFTVRWRGHPIDVVMERMQGARGVLSMSVRAGFVGSTADDKPALSQPRREVAFSTLRGLATLVPVGWRLMLAPDHGVRLVAQVEIDIPASAAGLVGDVTLFLLTAAPYLDLLTEAGVSGTAKI